MNNFRKLRNIVLVIFVTSGLITTSTSATGNTLPGDTIRISVNNNGTEGNQYSSKPKISSNGRFIAFESEATTLIDNDENGFCDIFIFDKDSGLVNLVSVNSNSEQGNNESQNPAISGNGQYVAFVSNATNLDGSISGDFVNIFVHDRETEETFLVSKDSIGIPANAISNYPSISFNGNLIVFHSKATNLVPGGTNGHWQIFVHNRSTAETDLVSVSSEGVEGNHDSEYPVISQNGRYIAFTSYATNLVTGDTNGIDDIFIHDLQTGETIRVSVATNGAQGNSYSNGFPSISSDGRFVAFQSDANNLVDYDTNSSRDIFVRDVVDGVTSRVSINSLGVEAIDNCLNPIISGDGRFVAFHSYTWNLVPSDTNSANDVFLHDRLTSTTTKVSVSSEGNNGNGPSVNPSMSADGYYIAFQSAATDLVEEDTNGFIDVFLHDNRKYAEITSADHTIFNNDVLGSFTITSKGFPLPSLQLFGTLPPGVEFIDNSDGTGTISGIADKCSGGEYILTIEADNGILPVASQTFSLSVDSDKVCLFLPLLTK